MLYLCDVYPLVFKNTMKNLIVILLLLLSLQSRAQVGDLPRSTPEEQGVPSEALIEMFDSLMVMPGVEIHNVTVMRNGKVIAELSPAPFKPGYGHVLFSCSKTYVAAAVGLAVEENRLRLSDRVAVFFPEQMPDTISDALSAMTVRDLLTMTSGIKPDWNIRSRHTDWRSAFLAKEVADVPGEKFQYDSMVTYMLSGIVQKVTGMTVLDYLKEKLFGEMHITDAAWESCPEGINTGGWGLYLQPESMAKFAQLLLDGGRWQGKQLIAEEWVNEMCRKQVATGREDYGYQTWVCPYPTAFRADGALGQFAISIPQKQMVIVITETSLTDGIPQRNLFWKLCDRVGDQPLKPGKAYQRLQKQLAAATLPLVKGKASSRQMMKLDGQTLTLGKNKLGWKSMAFAFEKGELRVTVTENDGKSYVVPFGHNHWTTDILDGYPLYTITAKNRFSGIEGPFYASGSYAWTAPDELQMKLHYVNWFSALHFTLRLENDGYKLIIRENYAKKPFEVVVGLEK